jgi:hypothetical protein
MAQPPEPLSSALFDAKAVVVGEITAIDATGPEQPKRTDVKKGFTDVGNPAAWQKVTLRVDEVLRPGKDGVVVKKGGSVSVLKPEGAYVVGVGTKGPFLLGAPGDDGVAPILGRYGPDSWRLELVEHFTHGRSRNAHQLDLALRLQHEPVAPSLQALNAVMIDA